MWADKGVGSVIAVLSEGPVLSMLMSLFFFFGWGRAVAGVLSAVCVFSE